MERQGEKQSTSQQAKAKLHVGNSISKNIPNAQRETGLDKEGIDEEEISWDVLTTTKQLCNLSDSIQGYFSEELSKLDSNVEHYTGNETESNYSSVHKTLKAAKNSLPYDIDDVFSQWGLINVKKACQRPVDEEQVKPSQSNLEESYSSICDRTFNLDIGNFADDDDEEDEKYASRKCLSRKAICPSENSQSFQLIPENQTLDDDCHLMPSKPKFYDDKYKARRRRRKQVGHRNLGDDACRPSTSRLYYGQPIPSTSSDDENKENRRNVSEKCFAIDFLVQVNTRNEAMRLKCSFPIGFEFINSGLITLHFNWSIQMTSSVPDENNNNNNNSNEGCNEHWDSSLIPFTVDPVHGSILPGKSQFIQVKSNE
ncbi:unnamed protein product [Trichobilharzia szidati]|nr:unnamed protein product [Trichobilharzia szidati]